MTRLRSRVLAWGLVLVALSGWCEPSHAQDEAVIKRSTALRAQPGDNANSVGHLAANDSVTRTALRQGAWIQVRSTSGVLGWVHMFDVGTPGSAAPAAPTDNAATNSMRGLGQVFGGSSATRTATNTVGIRGLGAGDVSRTTGGGPNYTASTNLQQIDGMRVSAEEAHAFALSAAFKTQSVQALPVPAPPPQALPAAARPSQGFDGVQPSSPFMNSN
jgi:hypothetical protein